MVKMKKYLLYVFLIAAFWVFSDILIYLSINTTYANVDTKVFAISPEVTVGKSEATYVNGVIKGTVRNNTDTIINDKYLKIDLYSSRDVKKGTKYVKIENLDIDKSQAYYYHLKILQKDRNGFVHSKSKAYELPEDVISVNEIENR